MEIKVGYKRVNFKLNIERKVTIIRGNSATGKSTLISLLLESRNKNIGIQITSPLPCRVLYKMYDDEWKRVMNTIQDHIIFLDEDEDYVESKEFASCLKTSNNYFVIITRSKLSNLPISTDSIFELRTDNKRYNVLKSVYTYKKEDFKPDVIVMEDSKSGYDFVKRFFEPCITTQGKSKIVRKIKDINYKGKNVMLIADREALGNEIEDILELQKWGKHGNIHLELPYCFESLLLHSPLFSCNDELQNPQKYAGNEFNSWEQYYEYLIKNETKDTPAQYTKSTISECFIKNCCCQTQPCILQIKNNISKTDFLFEYFNHIDFSNVLKCKEKKQELNNKTDDMMDIKPLSW